VHTCPCGLACIMQRGVGRDPHAAHARTAPHMNWLQVRATRRHVANKSAPAGPIKGGDIVEAAALLAKALCLAAEQHLHGQHGTLREAPGELGAAQVIDMPADGAALYRRAKGTRTVSNGRYPRKPRALTAEHRRSFCTGRTHLDSEGVRLAAPGAAVEALLVRQGLPTAVHLYGGS